MLYLLGTSTTSLQTLIDAIPTFFTLVGTIIGQIVADPLLTFFAAIPIVSVGVHILRKLVGAANTI